MLAGIPVRSLKGEVMPAESGDEILTILAELPSGTTLRIAEGEHIHINSFDIPREHILVLAHPDTEVKRLDSVDSRVERTEWSDSDMKYDLYGTIAKVNARSYSELENLYLLDVGCGTVLVDSLSECLPPDEPSLAVGDSLFIPAARLELYDDMQLNV